MWKQPNDGTTVSKVVGTIGGGNIKPFRGDKDNILYVRMMLSSAQGPGGGLGRGVASGEWQPARPPRSDCDQIISPAPVADHTMLAALLSSATPHKKRLS